MRLSKKIFWLVFTVLVFTALITFSQTKSTLQKERSKINKVQYESSSKSVSINQMKLTVVNTEIGAESADLVGFGAIKWPGGKNAFKSLVWYDGLQLAGYVDGKRNHLIHMGAFSSEMQPGKIYDDGIPAIPENPLYRTYKIQRDWETLPFGDLRDEFETDYNQWPVQDGAPWIDIDGDGFFSRGVDQPDYIGDEHVFYVANDADSTLRHRFFNAGLYSGVFGIEFQVSAYAFGGTGVLGDVVFRKITMINKSGKTIEDFIVSWYAFLAVGDLIDDAVGIDTARGFIYGYNRDGYDDEFENSPPAVGYVFLETPVIQSSQSDSAYFNQKWNKGYKNVRMTNFNYFRAYDPVQPFTDPYFDDKLIGPYSVETFENTLLGLTHNGRSLINPITGEETVFAVTGDPVAKTGWYDMKEGWGNDTVNFSNSSKQFQFALEGFTFEPFDTQTVVIANIAAQGEDNVDAIVELRQRVNSVRNAYYKNFILTPPPPKPIVKFFPENKKATLWWQDNAESYDEFDSFLEKQNLTDTTYTFEGYLIEQYTDSLGSNPQIISVFDKTNGITVIEDNVIVNGVSVTVPVIFGNDKGLTRFFTIDEDTFTGGPLISGQEYYFGVRAYAYSQYSDPKYKTSLLDVIKIIPGKQKIDYYSPYEQNENVQGIQIIGLSDADITTKIIDPASLTGDRYLVKFHEEPLGLAFDLINDTKADTLVNTSFDISNQPEGKLVHDGFVLLIQNVGKDSVNTIDDQNISAVNDVLEIKNEDGYLENPRNVLGRLSSNGQWKLTAEGFDRSVKENLNWSGSIGYDTYEIRFTADGSEYYTTGYGLIFYETFDDPKGKGRLPFEIWKISRDGTEEKRMFVKIDDKEIQDTTWSKDTETNKWERIYAYLPDDNEYNEPIASSSGVGKRSWHKFGRLVIEGELPKEGTIIRITTFKPITDGDTFEITLTAPEFQDTETGKDKIEEISVFPNPFFAGNNIADQNFVRFIGVPTNLTIRIFTISGQLVRTLQKDDQKKYLDWDIKNENGNTVAGGMYIAHLDMPGIGSKVLKLAVIPSMEFLDRQ